MRNGARWGSTIVKSLFIDCNDQLAPLWQQVLRADDPMIDVHRTAFAPDDLPRLLGDYAICIDDHSYLPTAIAARCATLKHVVFLGTGAASYMNVDELAARGIRGHTLKGYGDTADDGGVPRRGAHGPRSPLWRLGDARRHEALRQDTRHHRPRRHRPRSG